MCCVKMNFKPFQDLRHSYVDIYKKSDYRKDFKFGKIACHLFAILMRVLNLSFFNFAKVHINIKFCFYNIEVKFLNI